MKSILFIAALFSVSTAFAESSAWIDATGPLSFQFENQSGKQFRELTLEPNLACWTTTPEGGGEAGTTVNEVQVPFSYQVSNNVAVIQIKGAAKAEAPRGNWRSRTNCGFGVALKVKLADKTYLPDMHGVESFEHLGRIGYVTSKKEIANLTNQFVTELRGQYVIKFLSAGSGYCKLSLLKKTSAGVDVIGQSYDLVRMNCNQ